MFERALNSRGVKLRAIHDVLVGASSDELNYIFQTINCAALVEVAWDETMVMLTRPGPRERLAELSVYSRSAGRLVKSHALPCSVQQYVESLIYAANWVSHT